MFGDKKWYQSKTFYGLVIYAFIDALQAMGVVPDGVRTGASSSIVPLLELVQLGGVGSIVLGIRDAATRPNARVETVVTPE